MMGHLNDGDLALSVNMEYDNHIHDLDDLWYLINKFKIKKLKKKNQNNINY